MPTYTYDDGRLTYDSAVPYNGEFSSVGAHVAISGDAVEILAGSYGHGDVIGERSVCRFIVKDDAGTARFELGMPVLVEDNDGALDFGGFVAESEEVKQQSTSVLHHRVVCIDNHYLADKRIVAASYESTSAGDVVRDLITDILDDEGVTAGTIEDGPTVSAAVFDYITASEALNLLAEKANFWWYIDAAKRLHFRDRTSYTAPWDVTTTEPLAGTVSLRNASPQYRNRQYIKGARNKTATQTATRKGDGATRAFVMGYPLAEVPTVTLNAASQTVGIKGVETGKDWYWSKNDSIVIQDEGGTLLTSSDSLVVEYKGFYPVIVRTEEPGEIVQLAALEETGTGFVEWVDSVTQDETQAQATESANAKLTKFATRGKVLTFRTRRAGLRPGHLTSVTLAPHGLSATQMLVQSVAVSDEGPYLNYDVTCVVGPDKATWTRFFASLAAGASVDLTSAGTATSVTILASTSESWTWTEGVVENVYACAVSNTTTIADTSLLVC